MSPANFEHVAYRKVFENEYAVCELEELRRPCDGATMLLLHARLARWSPRIFRECLKNWHKFRTTVPDNIFASPQVHDARWEKFVTAFGFQPLIDAAPCNDGEMRPIWINYGQQFHPEHLE
jgi:hypothetical protein